MLVSLAMLVLLGAAPPKKLAKSSKKAPKPPPSPAWVAWKPKAIQDDQGRGFVAVGRSDPANDSPERSQKAEDDAHQQLGLLLATWQEHALRCAKQASETTVHKSSNANTGALVSFNIETETAVSFYEEKVVDRTSLDQRAIVLLRQDFDSLMKGISFDKDRSDALREAVRQCGEQAFAEVTGLP
jgi:hypothetical protein